VAHHVPEVKPVGAGDKQVPKRAFRLPRHDGLVRVLALVVVDSLGAVSAVDVPEDVQPGLDAPDFVEEAGATEGEVEVVGLWIVRDETQRLGCTVDRIRTGGVWVTRTSVSSGILLCHGCFSRGYVRL
jgi:hypothetical protein